MKKPQSLRLDRRDHLNRRMDCPVKPDNGGWCLMVNPIYYAILRLAKKIRRGMHLRRCLHRRTGKRHAAMDVTAVPLHPHPVLRTDLSPLYPF
jgi:hypothetical protein